MSWIKDGGYMKKAYLILEDGHIFEGEAFGAEKESIGELVFTTGVVGYIETLTDPTYYGQIVLQTFPLIGNYGMIPEDIQGKSYVRGYVVREWCKTPSNFRCQYDIDKYLKDEGIPGICGVDTRELTAIVREKGVMNARICYELPAVTDELKNYVIVNAVDAVTDGDTYVVEAESEKKHNVTLVNYGKCDGIIDALIERGCRVTVVPHTATADEIAATEPDGIVLSNGPGDPAENIESIECVKKLLGRYPIFGVCLGHQILALANGGVTFKLKYGHRGGNQPVKNLCGEHTYITNQNHGYAVAPNSITNGKITLVNANDGTCEGIDYPALRAFSVQFHPESCTGPINTAFVFDKFIEMMGGTEDAAE